MMSRVSAETVGMRALAWIAAQDEVFTAFLSTSGASLANVRDQAADPAFLTSVLDFVLQSDDWVLDFAAASGLAPEAPMQARVALGGAAGTYFG